MEEILRILEEGRELTAKMYTVIQIFTQSLHAIWEWTDDPITRKIIETTTEHLIAEIQRDTEEI